METSFIPLFAIIAVLIIAFLLASLPQETIKRDTECFISHYHAISCYPY